MKKEHVKSLGVYRVKKEQAKTERVKILKSLPSEERTREDFKSLSSKSDKDATHEDPARTPTLGPSTSTASYFPFSAYQTRCIEETELKTDTNQPQELAQSVDTMAASDRVTYKLGPRHLTTSGEILLSELKEAAKELNKYRGDNGLEQINIPKAKERQTYIYI